MSAELLRRAAETMQERNAGGRHPSDKTFMAIAAWLKVVADDPNDDYDLINAEGWHAAAVSRAYLGEAS